MGIFSSNQEDEEKSSEILFYAEYFTHVPS